MDHALLMSVGIDCEKGIERCMGNVNLYVRLLSLFLDDANMARARDSLLAGDYEGVYARLHELKGISGNLGIDRLFELCGILLRILRDKRYEELPANFERLSEVYDTAVDAIREALG